MTDIDSLVRVSEIPGTIQGFQRAHKPTEIVCQTACVPISPEKEPKAFIAFLKCLWHSLPKKILKDTTVFSYNTNIFLKCPTCFPSTFKDNRVHILSTSLSSIHLLVKYYPDDQGLKFSWAQRINYRLWEETSWMKILTQSLTS